MQQDKYEGEKHKREQQLARAVRLREARRRHFKSIEAAADAHGWSVATLTAHEKGGRVFKYDRAEEYAKALDIDVDWLWRGDGAGVQRPEVSSLTNNDAARSPEKIISEARKLIEHIQQAVTVARHLHILTTPRMLARDKRRTHSMSKDAHIRAARDLIHAYIMAASPRHLTDPTRLHKIAEQIVTDLY